MADIETSVQVRVRVSGDGLTAALVCDEPVPAGQWKVEQLHVLLEEAGVCVGIREQLLEQFARDGYPEGTLEVAFAEPMTPGANGRCECLFQDGRQAAGGADCADASAPQVTIPSCTSGQPLARIFPPEEGIPGLTVLGGPIAAVHGKPAQVAAGPNTRLDDDRVVRATLNGRPLRRTDGTFEVQPVVVLNGNVDYAYAPIDFIGSLVVLGDVKGEHVVRVQGSLDVRGNVEDAQITAGGDVIIHQGFTGHGKGSIVSGGNVRVHYVMNQTIAAAQDVAIERESINASIEAGARILAPRAVIAGGKLDAVREVDVGDVGSMDLSSAKVRVGMRGRTLEALAQVEKDIKAAERQIAEVKEGVYRLVKAKLDAGSLPPDKEGILARLQEAQKLLPRRVEALQEHKASLQADLQKKCEARIVVRGTIHKDTMIEVNGARKFMENALQGAVFTERAAALEAHAL